MIEIIKDVKTYRSYGIDEIEKGDTFIDKNDEMFVVCRNCNYNWDLKCVSLLTSEILGFPLENVRKVDLEVRVKEVK